MNERGISPLIATVLIIGFTVILSVVVYTFVTSTVQEGIIDAETKIELGNLCLNSNVDYTIECHLGPYLRMRANNNGNTNITGLVVSIDKDVGTDVLASNLSLGPYGAKILYSKFQGLPEEIEGVRFSPRFTFDSNTYDCTGSREISASNIPMCEDYIDNNKGEELRPSFNSTGYNWSMPWHNNAVWPEVWSLGYNGGVVNETNGYHAKWVNGEGFSSSVGILMNDDNCGIGQCDRWLGVSQDITPTTGSINMDLGWTYGDNITISFYGKVDDEIKQFKTGIWHYDLIIMSYGFGTSEKTLDSIASDEWDLYSYNFIYDSDWDSNNSASLYLYGHYPYQPDSDGTVWYDNIQVFKTPKII